MHVTQNSAARGQNSILQRVEFVRIPLYGAYYDSPPNPWGLLVCLCRNRNRHFICDHGNLAHSSSYHYSQNYHYCSSFASLVEEVQLGLEGLLQVQLLESQVLG